MKTIKNLLAAACAAALAACAGLQAAQMALPETLAGQQPEPVQGLGGGRSGGFTLAGQEGRFERSASRLALFDNALARERFNARYSSAGVEASCRARETSVQVGVLAGSPRPYELHCSFSGAMQGELVLAGDMSGTGRRGRASLGGVALELRSVHRAQGSPLPLEAPIGYLITRQGQPVGAVELNGTPRLWRPAAGAEQAAVTNAGLALALLWPGQGG